MNIETEKAGSICMLKLNGRFDASWCGHLQQVFADTIRAGEHHIRLELSDVHYLSSAGIRLLLKTFKQLKGIDGSFLIVNASPNVENVLRMAGLVELIAVTDESERAAEKACVTTHESESANFELHVAAAQIPAVGVKGIGDPQTLGQGTSDAYYEYIAPPFLIGVGAIGRDVNNTTRMGELLAVSGNVAYQPTDGAKQPDYMISSGQLKADGQLLTGISADALPMGLARFEAKQAGVIGVAELGESILALSNADAAVMVAMTETAGLIGATLRQSPATPGVHDERFGFPGVRDWLSFSAERTHRDTTSLIAGIVARPGSAIEPWLRPLDATGNILGHLHAASFPYHPLRKGHIELTDSVDEMFEQQHLQAILHLLADTREFVGAGESQFYRGACWYAPAKLLTS